MEGIVLVILLSFIMYTVTRVEDEGGIYGLMTFVSCIFSLIIIWNGVMVETLKTAISLMLVTGLVIRMFNNNNRK